MALNSHTTWRVNLLRQPCTSWCTDRSPGHAGKGLVESSISYGGMAVHSCILWPCLPCPLQFVITNSKNFNKSRITVVILLLSEVACSCEMEWTEKLAGQIQARQWQGPYLHPSHGSDKGDLKPLIWFFLHSIDNRCLSMKTICNYNFISCYSCHPPMLAKFHFTSELFVVSKLNS